MERIGPDHDNLCKNQDAYTDAARENDMASELNSLEGAKSELIGLAIHFGPKLLTAIIILTAGGFVGGWVARATARGLHRLDLEPPVRQLLTRIARLIVLAVFAMMALQNLGVELLPLIAGIGVAGAGVALATQGVLSNVVAGLTIIFTKPYRVGEYISIVGVEGEVHAITLFNTALTHADRSTVIVPNRKVIGEILHNYGRIRQCSISVGVSYESDLALTLGIIRDLVRANARVLADPAPSVQIGTLADSAVQITINPWVGVGDYGGVQGELYLSLVEELRRRNISMPYPQREVRLLSEPAA
jgi:small conductance mechanosensitive channel